MADFKIQSITGFTAGIANCSNNITADDPLALQRWLVAR